MNQDFTYQERDMDQRTVSDDSSSGSGALHSSELKRFRISKRESQEKFWGRFGVTQSSGSRFETGLGIPAPVAILVKLYLNGKLSDGDLPG
ncbi:helix-turn-helix domain-containing protein [Massilia polaris]|uniref:helix-turn-helix domain-containing protein n=1 Tax=Massilia polaris TaxID=2728846 RepID=UPI00351D16AD